MRSVLRRLDTAFQHSAIVWTVKDRSLPQHDSDRTISDELRLTAVGRIASGIVHDANNALAVTIWNLERATRALAAGSKEATSADTATVSAMKAAGLLRRVLEYSSHTAYDASLVNLDEVLARLFIEATAAVEGDIRIDCQVGGGVGPVIVDETLLELGLLDLVAMISRHMIKDGAITLRASNLEPGAAPPEAPNAQIVLSVDCHGVAALEKVPLQATMLQQFTELAGGVLTVTAGAGDRCEIRLYLPRAVASSRDGEAFI